MPIDRRTVLLASGALFMSRYVRAADDENALFWVVSPPGRKRAILFGYERIAPALVPDLIRDGDALVSACDRVVVDMPQDVRFPSISYARAQMKPIVQIVSAATADRLGKFLISTPAAAMGDRISGLEVTMLLMFEGQHDATSTAAGTIVDHARSFGKPIDQLVSEAEMQSAWQAPDLAGLNNKIGEETMVYMLDLRDKVGPIGGYLEQLYRQRRANEIERVTADMSRHSVVSLSQFIQGDKVRELMFARALDMLTQQVDASRFMAFPLGILTGSSGILAALDAKGVPVTGRA